MNNADKEQILAEAKRWFKECISVNHVKNTLKLKDPNNLDINPFLTGYLASFLTGNVSPESIARVLVLARVLSSSITTSFGMNIQKFLGILKDSFGSTATGIDIEFIDQLDGRKKYCQLKLGPQTINKDDVETIAGHFRKVINLGRTNAVSIVREDMVLGVIYGEAADLNSHYKRLTTEYDFPVIAGKDFWHRLTGDACFYEDLLGAIASIAVEADFKHEIERVIQELSTTDKIQELSGIWK